jgi:uncharacterized membrane-anchored protein
VPQFNEDRRRAALNNEVHARPFASVAAPLAASHLAVLWGEGGAEADFRHLVQLCRFASLPPPPQEAGHFAGDFGAFALRWERHSEFSSYTFLKANAQGESFAPGATAIEKVPQDWLKGLPGSVLVAAHFVLLPAASGQDDAALLLRALVPDTTAGSRIAGGGALAWTDFRLHEDGFGRILARDIRLTPRQAGRMMQRLFEIETYRMMALLALPVAREAAPAITRIGDELARLTQSLTRIAGLDDERRLLDRLVALSAEAERIAAATQYRFGAGRAYYALVRRRIEELREERIEGLQTIAEFMDRRLAPAMRTCESVGERLEAISTRLGRVSALLRARVEVALEAQNRDLLASMDRRARLQLRLQQTVEGLSVAAITYYVVGLVAYAAKAAHGLGLRLDPELAAGAAVLPVAALVWWAIKRIRKGLRRD